MVITDELTAIIHKLGHPVEEIRIRALQSLILKFEHSVVSTDDLINHHQFFVLLLEWFNFPETPSSKDVLKLLLKFSENREACIGLLRIGALNFFVKLKKWLADNLRNIVDEILSNLLSISESFQDDDETNCIYYTPLAKYKSDDLSFLRASLLNPAPDGIDGFLGQHGYFEDEKPFSYIKYSTRQRVHDLRTESFKFCFFPWLPLSQTDRHVLNSTNRNIEKNADYSMSKACNFLIDVVLFDFPAEIFLQRPETVKLTLQWISKHGELSSGDVLLIVKFIRTLTRLLMKRIQFISDPFFFSAKHDYLGLSSSQATSPPTLSTSQSVSSISASQLSRNSPSVHEIASYDSTSESAEDDFLLKLHQLSVPQFCTEVICHILHLLHQTPTLENTLVTTEVLRECASLISVSLSTSVWTDPNPPAKEVCASLLQSLNSFATIIMSFAANADIKPEAYAETTYLAMVASFCDLTFQVLPVEHATNGMLGDDILALLERLLFDEAIKTYFKPIHEKAAMYVKNCHHKEHELFETCEIICGSLQAATSFLHNHNQSDMCEELYEEWISNAEKAMFSINIHERFDLAAKYCRCYSNICCRPNVRQCIVSNGAEVLLRMLSNDVDNVRRQCYSCCYDIAQESLNIKHCGDISKSESAKIAFLLNDNIVSEILSFGLSDPLPEIRQNAEGIMVHLLQNQLLMTTSLWMKLIAILSSLLPLVQAHATLNSCLGKAIFYLTDCFAPPANGLSSFSIFKGNVRLLYHTDYKIRNETVARLLHHLAKDKNSFLKLPDLKTFNTDLMHDMFIQDQVVIFQKDSSVIAVQSQIQNLKNMLETLQLEDFGSDVKISVLRQISLILKDERLHPLFHQLDGLKVISNILHQQVECHPDEFREQNCEVISSVLTILQYLCVYNTDLRIQLSENQQLFCDIFRGSCIIYDKLEDISSASVILFLLLFCNELANDNESSNSHEKETIPVILFERFKVPLQVRCQSKVSPYKMPSCGKLSKVDIFRSDNAVFKLKCTWNLSCDSVLYAITKNPSSAPDYKHDCASAPLALNRNEIEHIRWTCRSSGVYGCIQAIKNASSHQGAKTALQLFMLQISLSKTINHDITDDQLTEAFGKFLTVVPSSKNDEALLTTVLETLLRVLMLTKNKNLADFVCDAMSREISPLNLKSLTKPGQDKHFFRHFLDIYVDTFCLCSESKRTKLISGNVVYSSLKDMSFNDGSPFYNLARLEKILDLLQHITATPQWSQSCSNLSPVDLCQEAIISIIQIVSTFHAGRGESTHSFMGNGITKSAAIVLRHSFHELAIIAPSKNWLQNCFLKVESQVAFSELRWLHPLWTYRDPEVRAAGIGIAVDIALMAQGSQIILNSFQDFAGGSWAAAFGVLLDATEASIVREQAILLLCNLVANVDNMVGGEALKLDLCYILQQCKFFRKVCQILKRFYPFSYVKTSDVSSLSESSVCSSEFSSSICRSRLISASPQDESISPFFKHADAQAGPISSFINQFESNLSDETNTSSVKGLITNRLVAALAMFMQNTLIMDGRRQLLISFQLEGVISILCSCIEATFSEEQTNDTLYMYTAITKLFITCSSLDDGCTDAIIKHGEILIKLLQHQHLQLANNLLNLMSAILPKAPHLSRRIFFKWKQIFGTIVCCLEGNETPALACAKFLSIALVIENEETIHRGCTEYSSAGTSALESIPVNNDDSESSEKSTDSSIHEQPSSALLCKSFMKLYKSELLKEPTKTNVENRQIISNALANLMLRSITAKSVAIKEDFLETILDRLKTISADLNFNEGQNASKQDALVVQEIIHSINLINNFAFGSDAVKDICNKKKFTSLLHTLWNISVFNKDLMKSLIAVIITFFTENPKGWHLLAYSSPNSATQRNQSSSIVHLVISTTVKEMKQSKVKLGYDTTILKQLFSMLTCFCFAPETRNIICKSSLLDSYCFKVPIKSKLTRSKQQTDEMVISFLQVLSSTLEGQLLLSKSPGLIASLVDKIPRTSVSIDVKIRLVLRNFSFHCASKTQLLNNEKYVTLLMEGVTSRNKQIVALSISSIWTLCANNQKAKQVFRNENISRRINEAFYHYNKDSEMTYLLQTLSSIFSKISKS